MSDYKKSETRQILEEIYSGKYPVKRDDGREYYVRYNDNREELEEVPPPELRPLTEKDKAETARLSSGLRPQGIGVWKIAGEGLKGFGQGVVSGLGRVSGGATLGATDWLDRKTGGHLASLDADLQRSAESAGLGGWNKAAKFASELGGNIQGAGGVLVKGLSKAGLKGLKLASASGGLEGAAYGATGSDSLDELPENVSWGAAFGAALPFGVHGVGRGARSAAKRFSSRLMTAGLSGGLSNAVGNPEAVKLLRQGIKNNDDVAEAYLNRVLSELRGTNIATSEMVDNSLTSRININVPETIASERARYSDYMAAHGTDEVMDFAPIKNIKVYRGGDNKAILKSMVRNLEKTDPNFKFRTVKDAKTGRIYKDYAHLLSDPERSRYIHTFMDTYKNPQVVKNGFNNGYPREYRYSIYVNPEHNNKVYDLISKSETGKVLTKIAREGRHGRESLNRILMPHAHQTSDAGRVVSQSEMFPSYNSLNSILYGNIIVNRDLPHVSSLYEGLTPWQMGQLDKALKTGLSKIDMKAGSLESLNKVKQEINEMISKAQATDRPSEVWQLQELKSKFDNAMPEGLKEVDAGFARAKRLEDAFERNEHYNPNFVGLPLNNGWFVDNPALSAGLLSAAFNNLRNR